MNDITSFRGEHAFLSNFYAAPIVYAGREWPTAEHAYQASKTKNWQRQEEIRAARTPLDAKRMGRRLDLRDDWTTESQNVMREVVDAKFRQHPELMERLVATGDAILVEGNDWDDTTWGMVQKNGAWTGHNRLGRILMEVRDGARSK